MSLESLSMLAVRYYLGVPIPVAIGTTPDDHPILLERYRIHYALTASEFDRFLSVLVRVAELDSLGGLVG